MFGIISFSCPSPPSIENYVSSKLRVCLSLSTRVSRLILWRIGLSRRLQSRFIDQCVRLRWAPEMNSSRSPTPLDATDPKGDIVSPDSGAGYPGTCKRASGGDEAADKAVKKRMMVVRVLSDACYRRDRCLSTLLTPNKHNPIVQHMIYFFGLYALNTIEKRSL